MICDTHTHSKYSFDGSETIDAMCAEALRRGISVLAVTDHTEILENKRFGAAEAARLAAQRTAVRAAQERYPTLKLLYGCELGQPYFNPAWAKRMQEYPFDYVIGSVHFFRGDVDLYEVLYTPGNRDERIDEYFDDTVSLIQEGGFHALGHLDYILRRMDGCFAGAPSYLEYRGRIEEILELLVARDMALEINTSGLRKWHKSLIEQWILERFHELGGRIITIGSDAHVRDDLGAGFSEACELLEAAGFHEYAYYEGGEPIFVPLKGE